MKKKGLTFFIACCFCAVTTTHAKVPTCIEFKRFYEIKADDETIGTLMTQSKKQGPDHCQVQSGLNIRYRSWFETVRYVYKESAILDHLGIVQFKVETSSNDWHAESSGMRNKDRIEIVVTESDREQRLASFGLAEFDADPFSEYLSSMGGQMHINESLTYTTLEPWKLVIENKQIKFLGEKTVDWKGIPIKVDVFVEILANGETSETWVTGDSIPIYIKGDDWEAFLKEK